MLNEFVIIGIPILVAATAIALTRAIPYLIFGRLKELPKTVEYLGNVLAPSIMAIIIIYCIRNIDLTSFPYGLAELISIVAVILVHSWKRNMLISIIVGTACYMILIRTLFPIY